MAMANKSAVREIVVKKCHAGDTGVVNSILIFDEARDDLLTSLGTSLQGIEKRAQGKAIVSQQRYSGDGQGLAVGDQCLVNTLLEWSEGGLLLIFTQDLRIEKRLLQLQTHLRLVDTNSQPVAIPDNVYEQLDKPI